MRFTASKDTTMNTTASLSSSLLRSYQTLLQRPITRKPSWRHAQTLLGEHGEIHQEPNGALRLTRDGHTIFIHPTLDLEPAEAEALRKLRLSIAHQEAPESTVCKESFPAWYNKPRSPNRSSPNPPRLKQVRTW